jgi:hypothetical protein
MTHFSFVKRVAAMMGSTAFFAPLIDTSPCNGAPPLINKLSMLQKSLFVQLHRSYRHGGGICRAAISPSVRMLEPKNQPTFVH